MQKLQWTHKRTIHSHSYNMKQQFDIKCVWVAEKSDSVFKDSKPKRIFAKHKQTTHTKKGEYKRATWNEFPLRLSLGKRDVIKIELEYMIYVLWYRVAKKSHVFFALCVCCVLSNIIAKQASLTSLRWFDFCFFFSALVSFNFVQQTILFIVTLNERQNIKTQINNRAKVEAARQKKNDIIHSRKRKK